MYRPGKDWEQRAFNFTKGSPECRVYYEAGADAYGEALKTHEGEHWVLPIHTETPPGWVVFIPDEQE